ncbi:putative dsRNA-binding protein [Rhizobium leguminosarum]
MSDENVSDIRELVASVLEENNPEFSRQKPRDELSAIYQSELLSFSTEAEQFARRVESADSLQKACIEYYERYWKKFRAALGNLGPEFASVLMRQADIEEICAIPDKTGLVRRTFGHHELLPIYGNLLFKFTVSGHLAKAVAYDNFAPRLLSPVLAYYTKRQTVERVWITLGFGPPIERQSAVASKQAIVDAFHKLVTYLGIFKSENEAMAFIAEKYIPSVGIASKDVIDIVCGDSKVMLQEFCHAAGLNPPAYRIERVGGPDHAAIMSCVVSTNGLESSIIEGGSKFEVSARAAEDLLEKVASSRSYRPRLQQLIKDKYFRRRKYGQKLARPSPSTVVSAEALRKSLGFEQSAEGLIASFTLKSDLLPGESFRDNERDSFFGSQLEAFITVRPRANRFTQRTIVKDSAVLVIDRFHAKIGHSQKPLSDAQKRDIAQSVIYSEYRECGLESAASLFEKLFDRRSTQAQIDTTVPEFDPGLSFTTTLQEIMHKRPDPEPQISYRLLTGVHQSHAPTFECSIDYAGHVAKGVAGNKTKARNKASHEMLKKLAGAS